MGEDRLTQDEINKELDGALYEAVFNEDITAETTGEEIQAILTCMVEVTPEQWQSYALHCLQISTETAMRKKDERVH